MTPEASRHYRDALANVFWIGGPPDAGKSTTAMLVAESLEAILYRQDGEEVKHLRRADPAAHPHNAHLNSLVTCLSESALFETLWLADPPKEMALTARRVWEERIDFICDDLLALPADQPVVAEGPGLFPEPVLPLTSRPNQAIWLVPSEAFKRQSHERRGKSAWRNQTSAPDTALANHISRDLILANQYRDDLQRLRLPWLEIDSSEHATAIANRVIRWFRGDGQGSP